MNAVLSEVLGWLPFAACAATLVLACSVLAAQKPGLSAGRLAVWLTLAGLIQAFNGFALWTDGNPVFWCRLAFVGQLLLPGSLLWALLPSLQGGGPTVPPHPLRSARWRAGAVAGVGALLGLAAWTWPHLLDAPAEGAYGIVLINSPGRAFYSFILIGLVLGLAQIEQLLRTLSDKARYQLKFVLLGLAAQGAYNIYEASQVLLMGGFRLDGVWVSAFAGSVAVGMVAFGLRRVGPGLGGSIYISPQVAYGSLTFLFIGIYLLATGLLGEWIRYTGTSVTEGLRVLVFFFAALGLAVLAASRTVRTQARQFIARNFYRSPYDYRAKWLEVTDAFRATHSSEAILDQTLSLLSRTFIAPRLSIWMRNDTDGRFMQVRSVNTEMPTLPLHEEHPFVLRLEQSDYPVDLKDLNPASGPGIKELLEVSQAVLGVPIHSEGRLLAFILLSAEQRKPSYGVDDCDLVRAIAHHVGVLLSHAKLADERRAAAQVEAVNHLAAFCVHDLKNLAARLSLVVQNAQTHGLDPGFQASAMRTISTTVDKMLALIAKLSPRSCQVAPQEEETDEVVNVSEVIAECVASLPETPGVHVSVSGESVPPVRFEREQLGQVLTNLVLNARQAVGAQGEILIQTIQQNHGIVITIRDDGPGIPADRLPHIFRPFQTSKPGGLGLGLYQCRRIIEAHRGSVKLESAPGRGTTVRVVLPLVEAPAPA